MELKIFLLESRGLISDSFPPFIFTVQRFRGTGIVLVLSCVVFYVITSEVVQVSFLRMAEGFDEIIFWMINRTVCYAKLPCCKLKCRTQWVFFLHFDELKPHAISACCYLSTMGQHGLVQPEHHLGMRSDKDRSIQQTRAL